MESGSVNQILGSVLPMVFTSGIFVFFVKSIIKTNDEKHKINNTRHEAILKKISGIEIKLAEISGHIQQAINVRKEFKETQKDVWNHGTQLTQVWKVIDQKRASDCDESN